MKFFHYLRERTDHWCAKLFVTLVVMLGSKSAHAGWIDAMNNITALGNAGKQTAIAVFAFVGLCAIGYGGKMMWDKGGDRGDDIKAGRIVFTMVGGSIMLALAYFALQSVETLGGGAGDIAPL